MSNLNLLINIESFLNEVKERALPCPSEQSIIKEDVILISDLTKLLETMLDKQDSNNLTRPVITQCPMCYGEKQVLNGDPKNGMETCPKCNGQGWFLGFPRASRE